MEHKKTYVSPLANLIRIPGHSILAIFSAEADVDDFNDGQDLNDSSYED